MTITLKDLKLNQRSIRAWLASRADKDAPLGSPRAIGNCIIHAYLVSVLPDVAPDDITVGGVTLDVAGDSFRLPPAIGRWNELMLKLVHEYDYETTISVREATRAFREATRNGPR